MLFLGVIMPDQGIDRVLRINVDQRPVGPIDFYYAELNILEHVQVLIVPPIFHSHLSLKMRGDSRRPLLSV